jgi:hypothetical protein
VDPLFTENRRPQQSGFTTGRSAADAILALRLLFDLHREFRHPLYVAYIDLKSAFDSVDIDALWKSFRDMGRPSMLVDLVKDLYIPTSS